MAELDFYFDVSSPWTYLAFLRIRPLAARCEARIVWKPILVGGVFNVVNPAVYTEREAHFKAVDSPRTIYYAQDLQDWAELCGVKIGMPSFHPARSVNAMRGCLVADRHGLLPEWSLALFDAYWGQSLDIGNNEVLASIASKLGLDNLMNEITSQQYKDLLRANTDELIQRGGFGSPTIFVGTKMFFGNDRLPLVEHHLQNLSSQSH